MANIISLPGTRKATNEYLERLAQLEPRVVRIIPEDREGKWAVFIGEKDGMFEFAEGWEEITKFTAKREGMTLNGGGLMLRGYDERIHHKDTKDYQKIRAQMEETNYFQITGI